MVISRTFKAMVAAVVAGLFAVPALAQEAPSPADAAARCIERTAAIAERTGEAVAGAAERTAAMLAAQDENGAPDRVLHATARNGRDAVTARAGEGANRVSETVNACVRRLRHAEADPELIRSVIEAGNAAQRAIAESARAARQAINEALEAALAD